MPRFARVCVLALSALTAAPAAWADVIPPPAEINDVQRLLVGVWQEEACTPRWGRGHGCSIRTFTFGNDTVAVLYFGGLSYSREYTATAFAGGWTGTRDDATVKLKITGLAQLDLDELTLTLEGDGTFLIADPAHPDMPPARFTRTGTPVLGK